MTAREFDGRVPRWIQTLALAPFALGLGFLVAWALRTPEAAAWASARMKTNTALCLALLSFALRRRARRDDPLGAALAALAVFVSLATLVEYAAHVNLGIDELLARDLSTQHFPNRMAPNAALGFSTAGLSLLLVRRGPRGALAAQCLALVTVLLNLFAMVGHLYDATALYRPTAFIGISPYTVAGQLAVGFGVFVLRGDVGLARRLLSGGAGGFLLRRTLAACTVIPVAAGWVSLEGQRFGWFPATTGTALMTLTVTLVFGVVLITLAQTLDTADARRRIVDRDLRNANALAAALARAATVREVVEAAMRHGIPALRADRGAFMVRADDGSSLRVLDAQGYDPDVLRVYEEIPIEHDTPACRAVRSGEAVFVERLDDMLRGYRDLRPGTVASRAAWAALPLRGRERVIGVLCLSFDEVVAFDADARDRHTRLSLHLGLALDRAMLYESEKAARARAEAASRAKDEFLAMLGHELRTPLSPILTALELMRAKAPDAVSREREVIERQVRHVTRLVDDLLDTSRISRGKIELRRARVDLADVVAAAVELSSPLYEQKRHRLHLDVPRGMPVRADAHRLAQVISNLLTNAAKYTDPGGEVRVTAARDGDAAVLRVHDTGIGIPAALLPRLFERFVQGDRSLDRSEGGLGLGLAIAHSLVELHGGSLSATSEGVGHGSEFIVRLPLDGGASEAPAPMLSSGERQALGVEKTARCRVLVVDDNVDAAEMYAEVLRGHGHEVMVAHDGPSGLGAAERFAPHVAFLDIGLPVMDGYELARRLRGERGADDLWLIAVTGYGQDVDRARSRAAGFDRHMVKPVEVDQLVDIVVERARSVAP